MEFSVYRLKHAHMGVSVWRTFSLLWGVRFQNNIYLELKFLKLST